MAGFRPPAIPDRLWFHGWDDTGRIFAWERRQASAGADCDTRHVLYAVNAKDDAFVQDGLLVIKHDSPEADDSGQCRPKDLNVAERRAAFLRRHGIRSKRLIPPTRPTATKAGFWVTHGAAQLRFSFAVQHRSTDPYDDAVDKGAAYRLVLDGAEPVVIEDGRRRRPNVMDYRLDEARWFSSPTGDYGALIVQRVERGFEGAHLTWMSNGVRVRGRP